MVMRSLSRGWGTLSAREVWRSIHLLDSVRQFCKQVGRKERNSSQSTSPISCVAVVHPFLPRCSLALHACTVVSRATNLRMSVAQQRASMPIISQRRRCFQHLSFFVSQKTSADECMHLLYVFSVHVDRTWKRETILWNRSGILQTPTSCVCTCTLNDQIVSSPHKKIRSKLGGQRLRK